MFEQIFSSYSSDTVLPKLDVPLVLGLNVPQTGPYSHNASAALVRGAEILALCEQERFDRIKDSGRFPAAAIQACFNCSGLSMTDVDAVALSTDPFFVSRRTGRKADTTIFEQVWRKLLMAFGEVPDTLILVNHHLSHAASAFYVSGFNDSLVVSWDGGGDNQHTVVYWGDDSGITQVDEFQVSFGNLYNKFRNFLNLSDKGSLMGMASYGIKKRDILAGYYDPNSVSISPALQFASGGEFIVDNKLLAKLGKHRLPSEPIHDRHVAVAAQAQFAVEELCFSVMNKALAKKPARRLCLAGGVALNATFNGMIWRSGLFDRMYIQPNAPDGGLCLGAALEAVRILSGRRPQCAAMDHAYYGPMFSREEIKATLDLCGIPAMEVCENELMKRTVDYLTDGRVVGWFQGRMEFGPRALGNRSILADPRSKAMADKVNGIIKYRDEWRPFALSVLEADAENLLVNPCPDPFMITTSPVREDAVSKIAAVTHSDGTTRPQYVYKETNPRYHALLTKFKEATGVPGLLNTSFNLKGEPIVCTPKDALRTFFSSGMEVLVLGEFIVTKPVLEAQ
jgi:carbamoyltransferase